MKAILILFISMASVYGLYAQDTTLGLVHNDGNITEGYTLFTPEQNGNVYLVDNCGGVVNEWTFEDKPNRTCYLLENGDMLRAGIDFLEIRTWSNEPKWKYDLALNEFFHHHDLEPLANGNILCILYDYYTADEMIELGRDGSNISGEFPFRLDKIVEIKPIGDSSAEILWEWALVDHLVQGFDVSKTNYGTVVDHPELININFDNGHDFNFSHVNGLDYNSQLDQILFSARNLSEIYIIDHSTTTAEASSHEGGNSGKGGDILWRWGNPQVYNQGGSPNQQLFKQHDPKWVEYGFADEGRITVFNNRPEDDGVIGSSQVEMLEPVITEGEYLLIENVFAPEGPVWSWNGEILGSVLYEDKKSGAHALPNGNMIVCETGKGRITEINREGTVLWSYVNPHGVELLDQFSTPIGNGIFRGEKYLPNFPAFEYLELSSRGYLENINSLSETCEMNEEILGTVSISRESYQVVNPVCNGRLSIIGNVDDISKVTIHSMDGEILLTTLTGNIDNMILDIASGIYIVQLFLHNRSEIHRIVVK
ncbi:MAG: T9SS type A sorting domain-containing protein [Cytophagales bacterium]|nr:T9SS type A sorting domain-containing protein [Cytophagales bacterium]